MLRKKELFTVVTPIPGFIPRQLAISILHSHSEVITLNPLVIGHRPISAPRNAAADEFYSTWYEIEERIQYIPGAGRLGTGRISFTGCFHNMPWGLQTHIHAPMGIDLRNTYRICGNQPGEPPETREIGLEALGAPLDGLYLREDIEIKCNITMVGFVKAQLKTASKEMVQRIIKKAELVDSGVLKAMMNDDGKLLIVNPNDRSAANQDRTSKLVEAQQLAGRATPLPPSYSPTHPLFTTTTNQAYTTAPSPSPQPYLHYRQQSSPPLLQQQQQQMQQQQQAAYQSVYAPPGAAVAGEQQAAMELPGDFMYPTSTGLTSSKRNSAVAELQATPSSGRRTSVMAHSYSRSDAAVVDASAQEPRW